MAAQGLTLKSFLEPLIPPPGFPPLAPLRAARRAHQDRVAARVSQMQAEAQARKANAAQASHANGGGRSGFAGGAQASASGGSSDPGGVSMRPGQHALVSGMTSMGKTTLVTLLADRLQAAWRVPAVYIDSKGGEFDKLEGLEGVRFYRQQTPPPWPLPDEVEIAVWSPERDNLADYEAFLAAVKAARRPCIVVIDELSSLGKEQPDTFVPSLGILLKQGRALKITLLVLTQELAHIPRSVLRQTSHLFLMANDPADPSDFDTLRAAKLGGLPPVTRKYAFVYRSRLEPDKRWTYKNIQQFLGAGAARPRRQRARGGSGRSSRKRR